MRKLNLGCGQNKMPGYINVDKYAAVEPDVLWDLEVTPWPFETNSVDEIVMRHCLEHMGSTTEIFFGIIKELYRVSCHGGKTLVAIPHPRSDGFAGDPTHVRPLLPQVFSLFSRKNNLDWKERNWPNTPLALYLGVDIEIEHVNFDLMPFWAEEFQQGRKSREEIEFAIASYYNVVNEITVTLRVVKEADNSLRID
jgi:hypothetical protein